MSLRAARRVVPVCQQDFAPFTNPFAGGQSCDPVNYTIYNREEQLIIREDGPVFSPAPSPRGNELCEEVNVLTFGAADYCNQRLEVADG